MPIQNLHKLILRIIILSVMVKVGIAHMTSKYLACQSANYPNDAGFCKEKSRIEHHLVKKARFCICMDGSSLFRTCLMTIVKKPWWIVKKYWWWTTMIVHRKSEDFTRIRPMSRASGKYALCTPLKFFGSLKKLKHEHRRVLRFEIRTSFKEVCS